MAAAKKKSAPRRVRRKVHGNTERERALREAQQQLTETLTLCVNELRGALGNWQRLFERSTVALERIAEKLP